MSFDSHTISYAKNGVTIMNANTKISNTDIVGREMKFGTYVKSPTTDDDVVFVK